MMTMKKAVLFSVAAMLAATTMANQTKQTEPAQAATATTTAPAETAKTEDAAKADTTAADSAAKADGSDAVPAEDAAATDAAAPAEKAEEVPQDSPQVQKLVAMYPNLIARIAPYGKVCFADEEDKCDINITVLAPAVEGQAREGKDLYKAICSTCHDAGLVGAPKFGTADWAPRIAKGKAALYQSAINGFNAMPARGGADISDEEVQNAVDYIIEQSS